jgi:hypothetical protein
MDQKLAEKLKAAKSSKELSIAAHEAGITLSDSTADKYFAELHSEEHELTEDELSNVAGGSCDGKEQERLYEKIRPDGVCEKHTWTYWAYTGIGTFVLLAKKTCENCHYSNNPVGALWVCELRPRS